RLESQHGLGILLFLGVAAFSLLTILGYLIWRRGDVVEGLKLLALPLAFAGLPALVGGALVHRRLTDVADAASNRTAGTVVALLGMVQMLLAAALAWPRPWPVLLVCLLDFVALTIVAFRYRLPAAHALALPCLTSAFLMGYALAQGMTHDPTAE